jgi:RNA polymerase sigma factor (sigma-70 family)
MAVDLACNFWAEVQAVPMVGRETSEAPGAVGQPLFATTHWSVVLATADQDSPQAAVAVEQLCRTYWYPLYAYVRHRGQSPEDSKDLTQEFFYRLLQGNYLARVDPSKGKFRSFLLAAMNHFLANEWDRARTLKRGGKVTFLSLDELQAERRYQCEDFAGRSPEETYEKMWALALLDQVLGRLREETAAAGHLARFEELKGVLMGESSALTYAEMALKLGTTEATLKVAMQRLRKRYAELLSEQIAQTVPGPEEVEDELRHLYSVLS